MVYNNKMQTKIAERYFFFGLLLATLLFTFLIFRPFWIILILGISFSIVLYPVYKKFGKIMPNWLASILTVILFSIVLCGPLLGIGVIIFNESQDLYSIVVGNGNIGSFLDSLGNTINRLLPAGINFDMQSKISGFISYTSSNIANIFTSALSAFFSFILMLLMMFYFLKDGEKWKKAIIILSPLGDNDDEKIISSLTHSVNAVIKGFLFIAIIQGILMGTGLLIFGVPKAALWGVVASVASLLPTIGTSLVSIPAIIFLISTGAPTQALGLLIWSVVAVGMIDNLLSPLIVGSKINIPPLLILFSILGGISFLGPVGILVGPLTVSLLYALISIYRNEFK
jgi:predicted PurR-regulated permease PerM